MIETQYYKLKKPGQDDFYNVDDFNGNADIIDETLKKKADLGSNGKVPAGQLPVMDYIPTSQKGTAGGVATLGSNGKIPESQLGTVGIPPQIIVTVPSESAVTCKMGSKTLSATSTGTVTFNLTGYGTWTVTATKYNQTATESIVVDDVKQYKISLSYFSVTLKVTSDSGASVTATDGTKTFTGTVPSSGVLLLTITQSGTYTVTATKSGETTDPVTVTITTSGQTYSVECRFFNATFSKNTWAQIDKASAAGKASKLWSVGDTKDITISGETLTLVIMGFYHDDLASGGKAGITLGLKNLMATTRKMNASYTNSGGFTGSEMYSWLQNTLLPTLPSDLQTVLKSVNKKTSAGGQSSTINTNSMKLFLFSEIEIFGSTSYSQAGEGSQYSYFAITENRHKYLANGTGSAYWWWERSPLGSSSSSFCFVNSNGNASGNSANSTGGVCFGFCV